MAVQRGVVDSDPEEAITEEDEEFMDPEKLKAKLSYLTNIVSQYQSVGSVLSR